MKDLPTGMDRNLTCSNGNGLEFTMFPLKWMEIKDFLLEMVRNLRFCYGNGLKFNIFQKEMDRNFSFPNGNGLKFKIFLVSVCLCSVCICEFVLALSAGSVCMSGYQPRVCRSVFWSMLMPPRMVTASFSGSLMCSSLSVCHSDCLSVCLSVFLPICRSSADLPVRLSAFSACMCSVCLGMHVSGSVGCILLQGARWLKGGLLEGQISIFPTPASLDHESTSLDHDGSQKGCLSWF